MAAPKAKERNLRVGLLVSVSAIVLMIMVFFIGSEQKIFARKNEYFIHLPDAAGLAQGNPVKISGVTVGVVSDIYLPRDPKQRNVDITLMVDRKYEDRIRVDSRVRLKKLGLLSGDAYVDISPGTPRFEVLEPGATILAARQTNVDQLLSSGEDLVDNLVQISYSMKNILARVDRGEGLLGELTTSPETKQRLTDTVIQTFNKTNAILAHVESGKGLVGRLVYDDKYGEQLTASLQSSADSLKVVATNVQRSFESGEGAIPALLADPEGKKKVYDLVDNLRVTSSNLATFSTSMQKGEGLVPRLLNDKAYADSAMTEFAALVAQLHETVRKVNAGEGTAGKLVSDPAVYESINDILIGINESKMLRWLIRNRQQKGIDKRVDTQEKAPAVTPPPAPEKTEEPKGAAEVGGAPPPVAPVAQTSTNPPS
jgi:phospholipid/cholesterol/gamma-HCH transport system substrate-binding protein